MAKKPAGRKGVTSEQRRRRAARATGRDNRSDYKNVKRAEKVDAANKKGSCLPKLFMMLLPFAAAGTYLILRS